MNTLHQELDISFPNFLVKEIEIWTDFIIFQRLIAQTKSFMFSSKAAHV